MTAVEEKIQRAGAKMVLAYPWWSSLYLHLKIRQEDSVQTMGTDGTNLAYNEQFVMALTEQELLMVLLHEVGHCALMHPFRGQGKQPELWNIACDQAVNALLELDGIQLMKSKTINGRKMEFIAPGPTDKTAEDLYQEIMANTKFVKIKIPQDVFGPGQLGPEGQGQQDGDQDEQGTAQLAKGQPSKPGELSEKDWQNILATSRGREPGALNRVIGVAEPKRSWKEDLAEFIYATKQGESHTWMRPSRRIKNSPGWKREPEIKVAICIDTSGSISDGILAEFMAEIRAITSLAGVTAMLITCDADVHQVIEPGEPFPETFAGGGGTSFVPALTLAEKSEVNGAVYFTDGQGEFPPNCKVPVLWALTMKCDVPFGKAVPLY